MRVLTVYRWICRWLPRPAADLHNFPQSTHLRDGAWLLAVESNLSLLWILFVLRRSTLCSSKDLRREWHWCRQSGRCFVKSSQPDKSKLSAFRLLLSLSLKRRRGLPIFRGAFTSWPYNSILGILSSDILVVWPTHRSWFLMRNDSMPSMLHFSRTV